MLDDGKVPLFAQQGCWLTCHNGLRNMPGEPKKDEVEKHPYLGKGGLDKDEVLKFLPSTRADGKSWDKPKTAAEIAKIKAEGGFLDLMQWRAHRSNIAGMADDGYVLDYRLFDDGKNPFAWNVDRKTMVPKFMFDAKKVGVKALRDEDIGNPAKPAALLREENAAPYDPNAGWKEGDMLPARLTVRARRRGDPWSGQMGLPGGMREDVDADILATAVRETFEETGIDLARAELVAELDDLAPRAPRLPRVVVRPFVFRIAVKPALKMSDEVDGHLW
jgi:8-oxo-dGTP pyrophosphatase MutT (NUDIX family)